MTTTVQHKRSETAGSAPDASVLVVGELALNLSDGKMYSKDSSGTVVQMISYDADLFTVPESVDLGLITDTGTVSRDMGSIA